tara:strand:- start:1403 stop:1945 length:543 start_codon:yes stop_codon:yes gene_type:complete
MFCVPFEHYQPIENHQQAKEHMLELFSMCGEDKNGMRTDFFLNDVNQSLPSYYHTLIMYLYDYIQDLENQMEFRAKINSMWYQQTTRGQYHEVHNHGSVGLSCVWYLEFDPSVHQATTFYCPFADPLTGDLLQETPKVKEGDLIVFPSYLLHEQKPNQSDVRRTAVSFNLDGMPKPILKS